tara:strand:+ start:313 stop:546 length:234 start_codon:yes stop_codon:yes gene_type:complete
MNNKLLNYNTEYEESSDDEIVEINDNFTLKYSKIKTNKKNKSLDNNKDSIIENIKLPSIYDKQIKRKKLLRILNRKN